VARGVGGRQVNRQRLAALVSGEGATAHGDGVNCRSTGEPGVSVGVAAGSALAQAVVVARTKNAARMFLSVALGWQVVLFCFRAGWAFLVTRPYFS
jgi:hypothetical protein